jgi:iron complex transport system substrate-binding protein
MKKLIFTCLNLLAALILCDAIYAASDITLAPRIIALAPNITEILFALGADQHLVGVSTFSNYPENAKKIETIASFNTLNIERILQLRPTVVFVTKGSLMEQKVKILTKYNILVKPIPFNSLEDIQRSYMLIGNAINAKTNGLILAHSFAKNLKEIAQSALQPQTQCEESNGSTKALDSSQKTSISYKPKVLYIISQSPLMTVGNKSLVAEEINLCGGRLAFNSISGLSAAVSLESVLKADPDIILISSQLSKESLLFWQKFPRLTAIKNKRIFRVNASYVERPGPRIIQGVAQICGLLRK